MKRLIFLYQIIFIPAFVHSQDLYFPPVNDANWDTIAPSSIGWCANSIDSLYNYLEQNNTKAFILLKDGKIVLEQYFNGHDVNSNWYWASAGKSLTAFLVGIARENGLLSINDTSSKYLGDGWTSCLPEQEKKITIKHQLCMTTGLDDEVVDPYCTLDTCLVYKADAGNRWAYHNGPYTLLDSVLIKTTRKSMNTFVYQELFNTAGIKGAFVKSDYNNVFYSTARVMARFGLLILNKGEWADTKILDDTAYINAMLSPSQELNKSYGYLWWLNGQESFMIPQSQYVFSGWLNTNAPADMVAALGKNGQFINVVPSKNLVWIRMGDAPDDVLVPYLMNDKIWEYINRLECQSNGLKINSDDQVSVYPNPVQNLLTIEAPAESVVKLYDISGTLIAEFSTGSFNMSPFKRGIYLLHIRFASG